MIFDFIDGAAGSEIAAGRNLQRFDEIMLQPRVMENVGNRTLSTQFLNSSYGLPFGIAPMGMCNLTWPRADFYLARAASKFNTPVCLSSAASTSMEDMYGWAGENAWFQLYVGPSIEHSLKLVERARQAGYETLVLTVDVPQVSRRPRELRSGFNVPFSMGWKQILDFATHPKWSLSTILNGIPKPRNFDTGSKEEKFDRDASRAGADWAFLDQLREIWKGKLIVKGVTSAADAIRIRESGADAVYVSNHGGRQLDSAPPAIDLLPLIRAAVGPDYPLIFDSGVRNGEDIVKALALGADFVMIGRPFLYALGAEADVGLNSIIKIFANDISVALAQIGANSIEKVNSRMLFPAPDIRESGAKPALHLTRKKA